MEASSRAAPPPVDVDQLGYNPNRQSISGMEVYVPEYPIAIEGQHQADSKPQSPPSFASSTYAGTPGIAQTYQDRSERGGGYGVYPHKTEADGFAIYPPAPPTVAYSENTAGAREGWRGKQGFFVSRKSCVVCMAVLLAVVIALGVGIGVGVGVSKANSSSGSSHAHPDENSSATSSSSATQPGAMSTTASSGSVVSTSTQTSTAASSSSSSSTTSAATATATATTGTGTGSGSASTTYSQVQSPETTLSSWATSVECPGANGTTYMASGRLFLRLCATDFPGVGSGSLDFKKANTTSMEDCMTACAAEAECRAVTWVWGPQGYFSNYCWMKNGTTGGGVPTDSGIQESAVIC